jgi:hypothetical protein
MDLIPPSWPPGLLVEKASAADSESHVLAIDPNHDVMMDFDAPVDDNTFWCVPNNIFIFLTPCIMLEWQGTV